MKERIAASRLSFFKVIKCAVPLTILFMSCFDFDFESEYEDINGIYLEYVRSYPYGGKKSLFQGDTGYMINLDSLLVYDFTRIDSIYLSDFHTFGSDIADILIEDDYAFLLLPAGLRVIDMRSTPPQIIGVLDFQSPRIVKKSGNSLCIVTDYDLVIIDVTEKTNPLLMSTYELGYWIDELEVDSNFAYVLWVDKIQIIDIEDLNAPSLLFSMSVPDTSLNFLTFSKKGSYVYVAANYTDSLNSILITYDLSANHTLNPVSQIAIPSRSIVYIGAEVESILAIALSPFTLYLLNLEYPSLPCIGEWENYGGTYGIIRDNYIYTVAPWGLYIIEIKKVQ